MTIALICLCILAFLVVAVLCCGIVVNALFVIVEVADAISEKRRVDYQILTTAACYSAGYVIVLPLFGAFGSLAYEMFHAVR